MADRNNPTRGRASESSYSLMEFMRECPDDAACLDMLWRERFAADGHHARCPKCERTRKFHRIQSRPACACDTLRAPRLPARRDDLPQVLDLPAPLVLRDPPHDEHSLRSVRQAA